MNAVEMVNAGIEIRKDAEAGMWEVFNAKTGEVLTREQSDHEARLWRARRFTAPFKRQYCPSCLAEDLFILGCTRHGRVA